MQPLEEKDSSPLEDTEITRLIKVSRELGYKKQDKIPERNLVDFKPTSITQIAASSDHQKEKSTVGSESADLDQTAQNENVIEDTEGLGEDIADNMLNSDTVDKEPNSQSISEQKEMGEPLNNPSALREEASVNPSTTEKIVGEDTSSPELGSVQGIPAENDSIKETPNALAQDEPLTIEEAKKAGIEIGKNIAFTEFENKQQEALETFQRIIDNIKKKEAVDKTDLTQSILKVVTRLAGERAGSAIDEHPETFKNKIISFADKIEEGSKNLILNLNPMDANLLKKHLSKSLSDKKIEIRENSELFRGDFIFQMGAVEIGDLISEQIMIKEKDKAAIMRKNKHTTDDKKIEQEEAESDDRDGMQKTEEDKIAEIDDDGK
tara:strand:+ start:350 stop:1486 length:1137 start_codon:yes stop_codon:yes gene_type:complete